MHDDLSVFPNPRRFDPERWLVHEKEERLKYLFNFGKGQRMCLGKELALAEIYMALAMVFRRLGGKMRLFDQNSTRTSFWYSTKNTSGMSGREVRILNYIIRRPQSYCLRSTFVFNLGLEDHSHVAGPNSRLSVEHRFQH